MTPVALKGEDGIDAPKVAGVRPAVDGNKADGRAGEEAHAAEEGERGERAWHAETAIEAGAGRGSAGIWSLPWR